MEETNFSVEELIEQLADAATRSRAWKRLQSLGTAALPAVRDGLAHRDWQVRRWCAYFVDHHWDEPTLQRLLLVMHDPKRKVRVAAVHSIGCDRCKGGENPIDPVPHLARLLREDTSVRVRRMAALMLAIQQPEKRIAGILRRALRDNTDLKLQNSAKWGLTRYEQIRAPASVESPA